MKLGLLTGVGVNFAYGPPETVLEYALKPITPETLSDQDKATDGGVATTPVPDNEMLEGEFDALLLTVTRPVATPLAAGAKVAVSVVDCPGLRISPLEPLVLNPAPATVTCEMVTLVFPAFVSVMFWVLLLDTFTFPKFRLPGPELRRRTGSAVTVSGAALLAH